MWGRSVQSAIRRYLEHLQNNQHASVHTLQAYKTDLQQFLVVITTQAGGAFAPQELSEAIVRSYSEWLQTQGYRPATISRKFAALRSFLHYLNELGFQVLPEVAETLNAPHEPRKLPRMLDRAELNRLLEAPGSSHSPGHLRDAAILALLYESGFRATELVELRLADVELSQARIQHPSNELESVAIPETIRAIQAYLQDGRPHLVRNPQEVFLFLNQRGKGLTRQGLWLVVKRWAAAAGI
ncbi:MAG: hypothetical protein E4G99_07255, partial [Anaerolineales bacterium]